MTKREFAGRGVKRSDPAECGPLCRLNQLFKLRHVLTNGHCQSQQLLQGLLGMVKEDGDAPSGELDARGQILEFLINNRNRRLDEELRPLL